MLGDIELKGITGTYAINVGTNALCRLEEATGKGFTEVLAELQQPSPRITLIRQFIRATLVIPPKPSLEEAGAIMDDIGGIAVIAAALEGLHAPPEVETVAPASGAPATARKARARTTEAA